MTFEKHKVTTDALDTLGFIINENERRDAIHLAVEPIVAAVELKPGQHVRIEDDKAVPAADQSMYSDGVGIVDPFLESPVQPGDWFWLVVYPRQISSLRHVWEHPSFRKSGETAFGPSKDESETWLRNFCERIADTPGFDAVMDVVTTGTWDGPNCSGSMRDGYIHFGGTDASGSIPDEFWEHVENYTGSKYPTSLRPGYFSCAC